MSEPTETPEPVTRMQILERADGIRENFNQNGKIVSKEDLYFLLDTLETLLDTSQPTADEESSAQDVEPPASDAEPDDLVERTQSFVRGHLTRPGKNGYEVWALELLGRCLERAELRPTREEAMALAEEKQRIIEGVSEATCRAMDDAGKMEGRLRARLTELLTENEELRAKVERGETVRVIPEDRRIIPSFRLDDDEEEVSNPGPGPREVWCGYAAKVGPNRLMTDDTSFLVTSVSVFERDKHYWITVTEADDTPEEGEEWVSPTR